MNLEPLLKSETDRIEWKESLQDSEGIYRATCALANDLGNRQATGYLLIGVRKDGVVIGVEDRGASLDRSQQTLSSWLHSTKLTLTPSFDIEVHNHDGRSVIVVAIASYPVPPVVTVNGTAWVRQGTTTRRATEADLARLRDRRPEANQPFDLRRLAGATLDDLNLRRLEDIYAAERGNYDDAESFPEILHWLTQRQLGAFREGTWTPNPAAILIFGQSPQNLLPGARVEFVRYSGIEVESAVIVRKPITGTLPDQLEALWTQMSGQLASTPSDSAGIRSEYAPQYPAEALKELARNMIQHRQYEGTHAPGRVEWFADRIEFSNPGGPFGRATDGEFGSHTDYRNPIITTWLVELGYVEQLGRGIRRVRSLLEKNGNPPLQVELDGFTRVIVRIRP